MDSDFVELQKVFLLEEKQYKLLDDPLVWTHSASRINSFPISHRMCGEFTYDAWFDDDLIVDDSSPMSYDPTLR